VIWFYFSLLLGILLGVGGQFLLKAGADGESLSAQYFSSQSILGLTLYFAAALCYMFALREIPVSVAFPAVSTSYVLVVVVAYWRYDEPLGWSKLAGVLLICFGVLLVARQV
jgi:small multidrug resistance pump